MHPLKTAVVQYFLTPSGLCLNKLLKQLGAVVFRKPELKQEETVDFLGTIFS